jgi:hypothetical protein
MLSSFLNRVRGGVSIGVVLAFFHGQMSASMAGAARLVPGAPLSSIQQPQTPSTPAQPGTVQPPPAPPNEGQTTVVQVPVPKENTLDITVVDGEGASNIIGKKTSVRPLVEVRDEKNQLLEGAVVTFVAPADGASVVFSNGLRTVTVMTDAAGRARTPSFRAVNDGPFRLQVSASFRGQMVSTSISQTNFDSAAAANGKPSSGDHPAANKQSGRGGLSGTTWAIILGAGAAAAVGIGVGLGHKGSTSTPTTSATIGGPGSPTVGAP